MKTSNFNVLHVLALKSLFSEKNEIYNNKKKKKKNKETDKTH